MDHYRKTKNLYYQYNLRLFNFFRLQESQIRLIPSCFSRRKTSNNTKQNLVVEQTTKMCLE